MVGLLSSVSQLATVLSGLGLIGGIFKPLPPIIDGLQDALGSLLNPVLAPLGLSLIAAQNGSSINGTINYSQACAVLPYTATLPSTIVFPQFDKDLAQIYRYRQQQSVNLGGWFVLESWMTPSLFTCANYNRTSEFDVATGWGSAENARMVIERHWDTFITEDDFARMADIGINTIRLPIGYYALGQQYSVGTAFEQVSPLYAGLWPRVMRAINDAAKHKIGVLIDLHAAPGSQNGLPSSGISDGNDSMWTDAAMQQKTLSALIFLATQLSTVTNVVGLQLLNEPTPSADLETFYTNTISTLRSISPAVAALPMYIHDAFDLGRFAHYVAKRDDFTVLDHHSYFVFQPSDPDAPVAKATDNLGAGISAALFEASVIARRNVVIGEFSCALSNDSLAQADDPVAARKEFCTTQIQAYANITSGWHFWNWDEERCEKDPAWCMQSAIGNILPSSFASYLGAENRTTSKATPITQLPKTLQQTIESIAPPSRQGALDAALTGNDTATGTLVALTDSATKALGGVIRRESAANGWSRRHRRNTFRNTARKQRRDAGSNTALGYADGFHAAQTFATHGLSRLGFVEQYIMDVFAARVSSGGATQADAKDYKTWFQQGQLDAEALIMDAIHTHSVLPVS